ncbi:uncharacterized protein BJ212DRAFT_403491 [Suillus subaureus]|uniref:Secreted protein n=1 Tax=Suillus subaureus TaxID=48587 RepID=A0A9P7E7J7_9AGAM|nr:uncharacterized protein BJ212DRAFT_403491 [Suillus subaureus]KAG1813642.1 hypothetical protein BJ212DRAFT_403491 [Suillus subaureus]
MWLVSIILLCVLGQSILTFKKPANIPEPLRCMSMNGRLRGGMMVEEGSRSLNFNTTPIMHSQYLWHVHYHRVKRGRSFTACIFDHAHQSQDAHWQGD